MASGRGQPGASADIQPCKSAARKDPIGRRSVGTPQSTKPTNATAAADDPPVWAATGNMAASEVAGKACRPCAGVAAAEEAAEGLWLADEAVEDAPSPARDICNSWSRQPSWGRPESKESKSKRHGQDGGAVRAGGDCRAARLVDKRDPPQALHFPRPWPSRWSKEVSQIDRSTAAMEERETYETEEVMPRTEADECEPRHASAWHDLANSAPLLVAVA